MTSANIQNPWRGFAQAIDGRPITRKMVIVSVSSITSVVWTLAHRPTLKAVGVHHRKTKVKKGDYSDTVVQTDIQSKYIESAG